MTNRSNSEKIDDLDGVIFALQRYCHGKRTGITPRILSTKINSSREEAERILQRLERLDKVDSKSRGKTTWYYLKDGLLKRNEGVRRGRG